MILAPHPQYGAVLAALTALRPQAFPFTGTLYRACDPRYATFRDLLTGEGSRKAGGRWNAPGSFALTYLSLTLDGALAESVGLASHFGFNPSTRLPLTIVAVQAKLIAVLDVTSLPVRKQLKLTLHAMTSCAWRDINTNEAESITQAIGRAAFESGYDAVLVPSAVKRSLRHLNVFPANLPSKTALHIVGSDKLPKVGF